MCEKLHANDFLNFGGCETYCGINSRLPISIIIVMITEIDLASFISALISKQSTDLQLPAFESSHVVQRRVENPQRKFHRSNSCTMELLVGDQYL